MSNLLMIVKPVLVTCAIGAGFFFLKGLVGKLLVKLKPQLLKLGYMCGTWESKITKKKAGKFVEGAWELASFYFTQGRLRGMRKDNDWAENVDFRTEIKVTLDLLSVGKPRDW